MTEAEADILQLARLAAAAIEGSLSGGDWSALYKAHCAQYDHNARRCREDPDYRLAYLGFMERLSGGPQKPLGGLAVSAATKLGSDPDAA